MDERPRQLDAIEGLPKDMLAAYQDRGVRWKCHGKLKHVGQRVNCHCCDTSVGLLAHIPQRAAKLEPITDPAHGVKMDERAVIRVDTPICSHADVIIWGQCPNCKTVHWAYDIAMDAYELPARRDYFTP